MFARLSGCLTLLCLALCLLMTVHGVPSPNAGEKTYATVHSLTKRSTDGTRRLHIRALGEDHHLTIEPASNIFSPGFNIYEMKTLSSGKRIAVAKRDAGEKVEHGQFYKIKDGSGVIHVTEDGSNIHVEGILDNGVNISPDDNNSSIHVIEKEKQDEMFKNDYVVPVDVPKTETSRRRRDAPSTVNVEVLVVIDNFNARKLGYDDNKIKRYIGIFWNMMNKLYEQVSDPRINLVVSGLFIMKSAQDQPFITNNEAEELKVKEQVLGDFGNWLRDTSGLPHHDVAGLQLAAHVGVVQNGQWYGTVGGIAYMGGTCNGGKNYRAFFAVDRAPSFSGITFAVHELAHTFNAPHDGDSPADSCEKNGGYIMGGGQKWKFSSCSIDIMRRFLSSEAASCTWDSPSSQVSLVNEYPSSFAGSLDEQCQIRENNQDVVFKGQVNSDICQSITCGPRNGNTMWSVGLAVEGTNCGNGKVCRLGVCSENTDFGDSGADVDEQCKHFGSEYFAWGEKTGSQICSRLWCTKDNRGLVSIGGAGDGSPCGKNGGRCNGGMCLTDGVPSLLDQCFHFGNEYAPWKEDDASVCSRLWCTKDQRQLVSIGAAKEGSVCGTSGGRCRGDTCQ